MPEGRADAVGACVSAADHDDALVRGQDGLDIPDRLAGNAPVLLRQETHGLLDASQLAPRNGEIACLLRAARQKHGVIVLLKVENGDGYADIHVAMEGNALGLHLRHTTLDDVLFELEIGNAVAKQPARHRVLFIHMDVVTGSRELLGRSEAGWTRAHNGDALTRLPLRRLGDDPALIEGPVGDGALDAFDRDRHILDVQRAGRLARSGANPARHFREVICGMQIARRRVPLPVIDEVVPIGDLVVNRTAAMAIGYAAIHAARRLPAHIVFRRRQHELTEMPCALADRRVVAILAFDLKKTGNLPHAQSLNVQARRADALRSAPWLSIIGH